MSISIHSSTVTHDKQQRESGNGTTENRIEMACISIVVGTVTDSKEKG